MSANKGFNLLLTTLDNLGIMTVIRAMQAHIPPNPNYNTNHSNSESGTVPIQYVFPLGIAYTQK